MGRKLLVSQTPLTVVNVEKEFRELFTKKSGMKGRAVFRYAQKMLRRAKADHTNREMIALLRAFYETASDAVQHGVLNTELRHDVVEKKAQSLQRWLGPHGALRPGMQRALGCEIFRNVETSIQFVATQKPICVVSFVSILFYVMTRMTAYKEVKVFRAREFFFDVGIPVLLRVPIVQIRCAHVDDPVFRNKMKTALEELVQVEELSDEEELTFYLQGIKYLVRIATGEFFSSTLVAHEQRCQFSCCSGAEKK